VESAFVAFNASVSRWTTKDDLSLIPDRCNTNYVPERNSALTIDQVICKSTTT